MPSVPVTVVCIGKMRMGMHRRLVNVRVLMRNVCRFSLCMGMLMVRVMFVHMLVLDRRMSMSVIVPFGEMQPHAGPHQHAGERQLHRHGLAQQRNGDQCPSEGAVEKYAPVRAVPR